MVDRVGPYQVVGELGRGGMGVVYDARSPDGRPVAVKVLLDPDPELLERFRVEVQACAAVQHPNIVPLLDSGAAPQPYLVMERLEGETLEERLKRGGALPSDEAVALGIELAAAVQVVHDRGILHRDLKPSNVFLCGDRAVITDFGLARDPARERERLTATGQMLGTPGYMAPEQVNGDKTAFGPGTDVYALGVLLYECLTGSRPFVGGVMQVLQQVLESAPTPPSQVSEVDPVLEAIVLRCMAKDPTDRYASAGELSAALEDYAFMAASPPVRRRAPQLLLAVGVLAVLAGGLVAWQGLADPDEVPPPVAPTATEQPPAPAPVVIDLPSSPPPTRHPALGKVERAYHDRDYALVDRLLASVPQRDWGPDAWLWKGRVLQGEADVAYDQPGKLAARSAFRQALERDPRHLEAAQRFALASRHQPDYPSAVRRARALAGKRVSALRTTLEAQVRLDHCLRSPSVKLDRLRDALRGFERAARNDPNCAEAWWGLFDGLAKATSRLRAEGAAWVRQAVKECVERERGEARTWVAAGYALCNYTSDDPSLVGESMRCFDRALALEPNYVQAYLERGYTRLLRLNQETAGRADFNRVRKLGRTNAHMRFALGTALLRLKRYQNSEAELTVAIGLQPASKQMAVMYRVRRAEAREHLGDAAGAAVDYRAVLKDVSKRDQERLGRAVRELTRLAARYRKVEERLRKREWREALSELGAIRARGRAWRGALLLRGRVHADRYYFRGARSDRDEAIGAFREVLREAPDHLEALARWSLIDASRAPLQARRFRHGSGRSVAVALAAAVNAGSARKAGKELEAFVPDALRAVKLAPRSLLARRIRLRLLAALMTDTTSTPLRRKHWGKIFERALREAEEVFPDDPKLKFLEAFEIQRRALREPIVLPLAEQILETVTRLEPRFAMAWAQLGTVRNQRRNPRGAVEALQRAIQIDPRQLNWHKLRVKILQRLKLHSDVERAATAGIRWFKNAELYRARATARDAMGKSEAARRDRKEAAALEQRKRR